MKLAAFLACYQPFFVHDLHQLQNSGIAVLFIAAHGLMHVSYSDRAACPKNLKDLQFFFRRFYKLMLHIRIISYQFYYRYVIKTSLLRKNSYSSFKLPGRLLTERQWAKRRFPPPAGE